MQFSVDGELIPMGVGCAEQTIRTMNGMVFEPKFSGRGI